MTVTRILYRRERDARERAALCDRTIYESTTDLRFIDEFDDLELLDASGEVNCLRTPEGDIFAWWER